MMVWLDSTILRQVLDHHKQPSTLFVCLVPHVSIIIINIIYISVDTLKLLVTIETLGKKVH